MAAEMGIQKVYQSRQSKPRLMYKIDIDRDRPGWSLQNAEKSLSRDRKAL